MRPSIEQLQALCPQVDPVVIRHHLDRLEDDYFATFDVEQVADHVRRVAALSSGDPVDVTVEADEHRRVTCVIVGLDYPSEFSLITGLMAGLGLSIDAGNVFTYDRTTPATTGGASRRLNAARLRRIRKSKPDILHRRKIVDRFIGTIDPSVDLDRFVEQLDTQLHEVLAMVETDPQHGPVEARHRVNERVTRALGHIESDRTGVLYPVEVDVRTDDARRTWLTVTAQDTPAFLYSLSNAMALLGMQIERVRIDTREGRVHDEIGFVDSTGMPITDEAELDRIKLVVLLTKQFTYFLDRSPDPYTALSRFEKMVDDIVKGDDAEQWMTALSDPGAMRNLGRLLGASDFLWEDFIRLQYESLLPILRRQGASDPIAKPASTIRTRLAQELARGQSPADKRRILNRFKDHEVYLIDLDQILRPEVDFRTFAEHLTALAEAVVAAAARLAWANLVEQFGEPADARWAIFGLGKLGGAALGYASDIELLVVYEGRGETAGPEPVHVGEFFNLLAREISQSIEAKQEGIFKVDLRLRPYGSNSPLAVAVDQFQAYYGPGGDAASFERTALVRMRPIAGDEGFGRQIVGLRDQLLFTDPPPIDLNELWQMRRLQWKQKKTADGAFNAKYSPGALVDAEYATQILQLQHGHAYEALRSPRVHKALEALAEVGAIGEQQSGQLREGYDFMRRLINGLRMLRGSAKDLTVPPADSPDCRFLARRMGYQGNKQADAAVMLARDIAGISAEIRNAVTTLFGREALPGAGNPTATDDDS